MLLSELRARAGLSQRKLAELLGVHQKAVSNWETGLRRPRYCTLRKLAEVLGCSIAEIEFPGDAAEEGNQAEEGDPIDAAAAGTRH